MAKLAREVMTNNVLMVSVGTTLSEARQIMKERHIRHLPVMDVEQRIVGVISDRDLSLAQNPDKSRVEGYMTHPVEWMPQDLPLDAAIKKMLDKKISSILVADEHNQLVGIVTTDDLLRLLVQSLDRSSKKPLSTLFDIESLDEIAHQISQTGI